MGKSPLLMSTMAIQDLEKIWTFWKRKSSLEEADHHYQNLIHLIKRVQLDFTLGHSIESIREAYRLITYQEFTIYYLVNENGVIEVIRILPKKLNSNLRID